MVRRGLIRGMVWALCMAGAASVPAASISLTGKVEEDFQPGGPTKVLVTPPDAILHMTRPSWMVESGRQSGLDFKDVRLAYDPATDSLAVGINFHGIGGDTDGNGVVGTVDERSAASGAVEPTRFGGFQTVVLGFDVNSDLKPDLVAGIPSTKPVDPATGQPISGVDAFRLTTYKETLNGLSSGFGDTTVGSKNLMDFIGRKSIETSADAPGVEFEILNFSQLAKLVNPAFDPEKTLVSLRGYSGDISVAMLGKSIFTYSFQTPLAQNVVPEPATLLAWSFVLGSAAAFRLGRRRAAAR